MEDNARQLRELQVIQSLIHRFTRLSTKLAIEIAYSSGYVKMRDIIKFGLVADTICFALIIFIGMPLIKLFLVMNGIAGLDL